MAGNVSVRRDSLKSLLKATVRRDSDRARIKSKIDEALQEFNGKNQKLNYPNRAYKIRYNYAFNFWENFCNSDEFNEAGQIELKRAEDLVDELKEELNHYVLTDITNDDEVDDPSFFKKTRTKRPQSQSNPVWLITCKCENVVYLKLFHGSNENEEKKVNRRDILCGYCLISLGDEVKVDNDTGVMFVVRSKGLQSVEIREKAKFVENVLHKLNDESGFDVYTQFYDRYKGIWDYIKNDRELFKNNPKHANDFMKLCLSLCQKLSKEFKIQTCKQFLLDISSSIFFIECLPSIISNGGTRQYDDIKFFLKSMLKHNPQTARKVFKVAKPLAIAMHFARDDEMNGEGLVQSPGIEYLAELGEIVSNFVPGCQEVDTSNCSWEELPVIPTEREIFSEFDLNTLDAIKKDKPYDSSNQYLEINYRLLREECFRNLSTGIQKLSRNKSYDPRMMKLFRITLNTVEGGDHLVLECEDYNVSDSSKEEESVCSDEMLHGSLMCISLSEKFDSLIWATVVECEMKGKTNTKLISVELCSERNGKTNIDVISQLIKLANKGDCAFMAESPIFYKNFAPCMDRLKIMKEEGIPFCDELVLTKNSPAPDYTTDDTVDWSIIFEKSEACTFKFPRESMSCHEQFKFLREKGCKTLLDDSQLSGIENFFTNKVSLIQGPPGTGKSFLGIKILRLMLSMKIHELYHGPILVVTFKNVALDHFLVDCAKYVSKIVRIGRTPREELNNILLNKVIHEKGMDKKHHASYKKANDQMQLAKKNLKKLFGYLSEPHFTVKSFREVASKEHVSSLLSMLPDSEQNGKKTVEEKLKTCLKTWLEEAKSQVGSSLKKKRGEEFLCDTDNRNGEDEISHGEEFDSTVTSKERQLDTVEDEVPMDDGSASYYEIQEGVSNEEQLTDGIEISSAEPDEYSSLLDEDDLWSLTSTQRVNFLRALRRKLIAKFREAVESFEENKKFRQDFLDERTVCVLKSYDVIAMTVTGAATRSHLLKKLKPCAVIVEEAAEIMEGQLVSILPKSLKHLVMIGDHYQLKPRVNCYKLLKKNLDCSMFERLINNKFPFVQLKQQCRMRDDIADLLREIDIYDNLETKKEKIKDNEPPPCIGKSLFFLKHTNEETYPPGSKSPFNDYEVNKILEVSRYLMKKGYSPADITVICPYNAQVDRMKRKFLLEGNKPSEQYFTKLEEIKITTIDSFQGEENKVILLSLVRSNKKQKIGFLSSVNRTCVAISRAKCALYIFGNPSVYTLSKKWTKIIRYLENKELISSKFPFKNEPEQVTDKDPLYEIIEDSAKLSGREIHFLSKRIGSSYDEIGRLGELPEHVIKEVTDDNVQYPSPSKKAARTLHLINEKQDFGRKELTKHLNEAVVDVHDEVLLGTWRHSPTS